MGYFLTSFLFCASHWNFGNAYINQKDVGITLQVILRTKGTVARDFLPLFYESSPPVPLVFHALQFRQYFLLSRIYSYKYKNRLCLRQYWSYLKSRYVKIFVVFNNVGVCMCITYIFFKLRPFKGDSKLFKFMVLELTSLLRRCLIRCWCCMSGVSETPRVPHQQYQLIVNNHCLRKRQCKIIAVEDTVTSIFCVPNFSDDSNSIWDTAKFFSNIFANTKKINII